MWADEGFSGLEPNLTPKFIPEAHAVEGGSQLLQIVLWPHTCTVACAPSSPPEGNNNAVKELKNDATPY